jgi:hypothetical protein
MVNSHLPLSWDIVSRSWEFNSQNRIIILLLNSRVYNVIVKSFFTYIGGICFKWAKFRHTCLGVDGDDHRTECLVPVISTWLVRLLWLHHQTGDLFKHRRSLGINSIAHLDPDVIPSGTALLSLELIEIWRPLLTTTPKFIPESINHYTRVNTNVHVHSLVPDIMNTIGAKPSALWDLLWSSSDTL